MEHANFLLQGTLVRLEARVRAHTKRSFAFNCILKQSIVHCRAVHASKRIMGPIDYSRALGNIIHISILSNVHDQSEHPEEVVNFLRFPLDTRYIVARFPVWFNELAPSVQIHEFPVSLEVVSPVQRNAWKQGHSDTIEMGTSEQKRPETRLRIFFTIAPQIGLFVCCASHEGVKLHRAVCRFVALHVPIFNANNF